MPILEHIVLTTGEHEWVAPRPLKLVGKRHEVGIHFDVRGHMEYYPKRIQEKIYFSPTHREDGVLVWSDLAFRRVYHSGAFVTAQNPYSLYYVCAKIKKIVLAFEDCVAYAAVQMEHFGTNMPKETLGQLMCSFDFLDIDFDKEPQTEPDPETDEVDPPETGDPYENS